MKIALDYDLTYTADEVLWHKFLNLAQVRGHDTRVVTIRDDRYDRTAPLIALEQHMPVIYTRGVAKQFFVQHFVPDFWPVSVWIDDKPRTIFENSDATPEALVQWRAERDEGVTTAMPILQPCPICGLTTPHHPDHSLP